MSWAAVDWVFKHSEATGPDRAVLLALAWRMRKGNPLMGCWPGLETIAKDAGVSRSTAFRSLGVLEEKGELHITRESGKSSVYRMPALLQDHPAQSDTAHSDTGQSDTGPCSDRDGGLLTETPEPVSNCERTAGARSQPQGAAAPDDLLDPLEGLERVRAGFAR